MADTKRDISARTLALAAFGTAAFGLGLAVAGLTALRRTIASGGEHAAPDLALDQPRPGTAGRAPEAFRPDPTAPVSASEREALRPATGPSPSLVEDRGGMNSQTAPANG